MFCSRTLYKDIKNMAIVNQWIDSIVFFLKKDSIAVPFTKTLRIWQLLIFFFLKICSLYVNQFNGCNTCILTLS